MKVYSVIAVVNGNPLASWVLASNPDDAATKAQTRLPEGGKLKIVVPLCVATLTQFERNKLYQLLPIEDGLEFTAGAMLDLVKIQQISIRRLSEVAEALSKLEQQKQKDTEP